MSFGNVLRSNLEKKSTGDVFKYQEFVTSIVQNAADPAFHEHLAHRLRGDGFTNIKTVRHHLSVVAEKLRRDCFEGSLSLMYYDLNEYRIELMTAFIEKLFASDNEQFFAVMARMSERTTRSSVPSVYRLCTELNKSIFRLYGDRDMIWDNNRNEQWRMVSRIFMWELLIEAADYFKTTPTGQVEFIEGFFNDPTVNFRNRMHELVSNANRHNKFVGRNGVTYDLEYSTNVIGQSTEVNFFEEQRVDTKLSDAEQEALENSLREAVKPYGELKIRDKKIFIKFHKALVPNSATYSSVRNGNRLIFPDELITVLAETRYRIQGFSIPLNELKTTRTLPGAVYAYSHMDLQTMQTTTSYHPHASGDGNVCLGNMNRDEKDQSFTIADLVRMLTTLNLDSVYRGINLDTPLKVKGAVIKTINSDRSSLEEVGKAGSWEAPIALSSFFK